MAGHDAPLGYIFLRGAVFNKDFPGYSCRYLVTDCNLFAVIWFPGSCFRYKNPPRINSLCSDLHELEVIIIRIGKCRYLAVILNMVNIPDKFCSRFCQSFSFLFNIINFQIKN
jgi:hypothetical protein